MQAERDYDGPRSDRMRIPINEKDFRCLSQSAGQQRVVHKVTDKGMNMDAAKVAGMAPDGFLRSFGTWKNDRFDVAGESASRFVRGEHLASLMPQSSSSTPPFCLQNAEGPPPKKPRDEKTRAGSCYPTASSESGGDCWHGERWKKEAEEREGQHDEQL